MFSPRVLSVLMAMAVFGAVYCDHHQHREYHEHHESGEEHEHHYHHQREYHAEEVIDYFLKNPVTKQERQCFEEKIRIGDSIDFVIDIAPNPSDDKVDKMVANSPIGLYLEQYKPNRSPTRVFFDSIRLFIDLVTIDMKPERTSSIIYENGNRYYLQGRKMNETSVHDVADFSDVNRNFKTMFPVLTKSVPDVRMGELSNNNLGYMTKVALWSRNNGLPTVLAASKNSKPLYTIVLTDGSSGASITDLTDDLTRTSVIDMGNRRFTDKLQWEQIRLMPSVISLSAPQTLLAYVNTVRNMACLLATNSPNLQPPM